MYAEKDNRGEIAIHAINEEEGALIQTAALRLAEQSPIPEHARKLRRLAMDLDKMLSGK